MRRILVIVLAIVGVGLAGVGSPGGVAFGNGLTLTAAGVADGFSLSTFATTNPGNTGCCNGPFGVAVAATGNILVATGSGHVYVFADADGQTTGTALFTQPSFASSVAFATAGGHPYGAEFSTFAEYNSDGTANHILTGVSGIASPWLGMAGDPVNGHIIATSNQGLLDIDPLANGGLGSYRNINPHLAFTGDGLSVSPDGTVAYLEVGGEINGYSIASGLQVFSSGPLFGLGLGEPDGAGVISSSNSLNGDLIINFNGNGVNTGGIGLLDPTTHVFTIIASGGTRGDYVSPDTNNGTLFLDYSDTVERLSCGAGCGIGGPPPPPPTVPEPASLVLLGSGMAGLAGWRSWRRRKQA